MYQNIQNSLKEIIRESSNIQLDYKAEETTHSIYAIEF